MGEEIGTLVVVVLKARNLRDKHTFYKQDAYAQATLNKETKKTKVDVKGGQHPVWDEELRFPIMKRVSDETRMLEVSCWSKEPRADECVGRGTVDITETLKTGEFDDWVPLKMEDGAYRGEVFLEMTYYAKTPPLQRRASKWKPTERLTRPATTYAYADLPPVPSAAPGTAPRHDGAISAAAATSDSDELPLPGYPSNTPPSHASPGGHSAHGPHRSPAHNHDALPPLPEEPEAPLSIPVSLRPGGPRTSPGTSPKAAGGLLPPEHPLHTRAPVPPGDHSPPTQPPFESVPPYLRPGGGHTPIPEPQIPPPQSYAPPAQPYSVPAQRYPPPHPYAPPPQPYEPAAPAYGAPAKTYGSPPQHYVPPPSHAYIPPSVPPQAQSYPPYAYSAPLPAADDSSSDLPDPYLQARYKTPLPLPSEPPGMSTPTPANPRPHPQRQSQPRRSSPPLPPKDRHPSPSRQKPVPAAPPRHPAQASRDRSKEAEERERLVALQLQKEKEEEERDRLLALQIEKEEEERQRRLREQEERDSELARQLDLELNLEQEAAAREREEATPAVPGAW